MSDLSELDIVAEGDAPQPLDLVSPIDGAVIRSATGEPVTLYVLSSYSNTMQRYADDQANKAARHAKQPTAEDLRERALSFTARLLIARPWTGVEWKGEALACNLVNAKLLMRQLPWARRQVEAFAAQEGNFLGGSSASSSSTPSTTSASAATSATPD